MIPKVARLQWFLVGAALVVFIILGVFLTPLTILFSKPMTNRFGETSQRHRDKYIAKGSSGSWQYVGCTVPILRWWSNLEDGNYGEPSGKYSASCQGKESTFLNQYYWLAVRNPVNYLKRTNPFFHCPVNDCVISFKGDEVVGDKGDDWGEQLVIARSNKRTYYGYYKTEKLDEEHCRVKRYGFKIKPSHAYEVQDADDLDKAFTLKYQHKSDIN